MTELWLNYSQKSTTHRAAIHLINNIKYLLLSLRFPFILIYVSENKEKEKEKAREKRHCFSHWFQLTKIVLAEKDNGNTLQQGFIIS